jgi:sigma-B regulation protein RsbU (phosphoserine phosphatase)
MAVGMFEEAIFNTGKIKLKMGERLVCYTDGVTDLQNPAGEEFGSERFETFIQESVASNPKSFFNETFEILKSFQGSAVQADDITMIVMDVLMPWAKQTEPA